MDCQIVHDSYHARGFTDSYLLEVRGEVVGYGSLAGDPSPPREIVKEFYVVPDHRQDALMLFRALVLVARPRWIEAQTNDPFLMPPLLACATGHVSDRVLFSEGVSTDLTAPGVVFRPVTNADRRRVFPHTLEPIGDWALDLNGEVVATGGLMFHYNPPYGDIYMEVAEAHRRRGYGSYLVQRLKRLCREMGCRPAARTSIDNVASRRTLERAGMLSCAQITRGAVVNRTETSRARREDHL